MIVMMVVLVELLVITTCAEVAGSLLRGVRWRHLERVAAAGRRAVELHAVGGGMNVTMNK